MRDLQTGLGMGVLQAEDGAISHGLGDKGGKGLPLFNECLQSGEGSFRIVLVKRQPKKEPRRVKSKPTRK